MYGDKREAFVIRINAFHVFSLVSKISNYLVFAIVN